MSQPEKTADTLKEKWDELPPAAQAGFGALAAFQVGLQIYALNALRKTPKARVRGGRKTPWALVIIVGELIGAPVFLKWGRKP